MPGVSFTMKPGRLVEIHLHQQVAREDLALHDARLPPLISEIVSSAPDLADALDPCPCLDAHDEVVPHPLLAVRRNSDHVPLLGHRASHFGARE
jgi:hypothetical protein